VSIKRSARKADRRLPFLRLPSPPRVGFLAKDELPQHSLVFTSHVREGETTRLKILVECVEAWLGARPNNLPGPGDFEFERHNSGKRQVRLDQLADAKPGGAQVRRQGAEGSIAHILSQEQLDSDPWGVPSLGSPTRTAHVGQGIPTNYTGQKNTNLPGALPPTQARIPVREAHGPGVLHASRAGLKSLLNLSRRHPAGSSLCGDRAGNCERLLSPLPGFSFPSPRATLRAFAGKSRRTSRNPDSDQDAAGNRAAHRPANRPRCSRSRSR